MNIALVASESSSVGSKTFEYKEAENSSFVSFSNTQISKTTRNITIAEKD